MIIFIISQKNKNRIPSQMFIEYKFIFDFYSLDIKLVLL